MKTAGSDSGHDVGSKLPQLGYRSLNVLISGGAGFIGTRLARHLLVQGHTLTLIDNFSPQIHGGHTELAPDLQNHVRLVRGDVCDRTVWEATLPGQHAVIHLAAETGTGQSMYEIARYNQVNLSGTAQLYDLLAKNGGMSVERIVVASSRAIYGEGAYRCATHGLVYPQPRSSDAKKTGLFNPTCPLCDGFCEPVATPETAPFQPSSFYGLTKQVQEQMVLMFGKVLGIPSFALRYQNVYGPGQSLNNPYTGILAIFSNLARIGQPINVFEDGLESRDFVFIQDIVRATADCLDVASTESCSLNVGSAERITVLQIAEAVNAYFGNRSTVSVSGAFREGDIRHGMADLTRVTHVLGYQPRTSFSHGLHEFLAWTTESEPNTGAYERSLDEMKQRGLLHGS